MVWPNQKEEEEVEAEVEEEEEEEEEEAENDDGGEGGGSGGARFSANRLILWWAMLLACPRTIQPFCGRSKETWLWPSRPKWVALLPIHLPGTATFPKGVPYTEFGFSTKSVSPIFSTSEIYTCYTHKTFIIVISKCLKQATLQ